MTEFIEIQRKFVDTLLKIPGMSSFEMRDSLLQGLPPPQLIRSGSSARLDLNNVISGLEQLGRLNDQGGTRPLIVVAENALQYTTPGGKIATALNEIVEELTAYYGGDVQPEFPALAPGEQEALVFGRQRDSRLPFSFVEEAWRTGRSVARLSVPRIFHGVRCGQEQVYGTGWLIAPGLIITNHHVIEARDRRPRPMGRGEGAARPSDFEAQARGVVARFDYHQEVGEYLECHHATLVAYDEYLDYAILQLAEASKVADRSPLRVVRQQPEFERGSRLNIVQHSGGGPLRYAIRNNFFVRTVNAHFIRYQTDTEEGASGSPVCNDSWEVVALHHAHGPTLAEQVPQEVIEGNPVEITVLNQAIAIHSILESLPVAVRQQIIVT